MGILVTLNSYIAFGRIAIFPILIFQSLSMECVYILLCLLQFLSEFWSFHYRRNWLVRWDLLQSTFKESYHDHFVPRYIEQWQGCLGKYVDYIHRMGHPSYLFDYLTLLLLRLAFDEHLKEIQPSSHLHIWRYLSIYSFHKCLSHQLFCHSPPKFIDYIAHESVSIQSHTWLIFSSKWWSFILLGVLPSVKISFPRCPSGVSTYEIMSV